MADPFTLAMIGATAGALTNEDDPLKGAILGGLTGYAGGSMLGAGSAAGSAAGTAGAAESAALAANAPTTITPISATMPVADVGFIPGIENLAMQTGAPVMTPGAETLINGVPVTSYNIPFDPVAYNQTAGLQGAMRGAGNLVDAAFGGGGGQMGMKEYMGLQMAGGLLSPQQGGPTRQEITTQGVRRGEYQPNVTAGGLLAPQNMRRRPFAFA